MAALAYVLLPVSGLIAYSVGGTSRTRFHGLQAVVLGFVWPLVLYGCSLASSLLTQVAFAAGSVGWIVLIAATAAGRDPQLPVIGDRLRRAAGLD